MQFFFMRVLTVTCILNLTKDRTTNTTDLPPNLRVIDMKIISLSTAHLAIFVAIFIAALKHQTLLFKIMLLLSLDIQIIQMIDIECIKFIPLTSYFVDFYQNSFRGPRISRTFSQVCEVLGFAEFTWHFLYQNFQRGV